MSADFFKKDTVVKKKAYLFGALWGVAATVVSMLLLAFALLITGIDRAYSAPFATISLAIGSLVSSRYTAKKIGDKGYIIGFVIGSVVFILITLLSLIIGENGLSINTLFHFVVVMLSALAGGISGVNAKAHKKFI